MVVDLAQRRDPNRLARDYRPVVVDSTARARNRGATILLPASALSPRAVERPAGVKNVYCTDTDRCCFGVVAGVGDQKKSGGERDAGVFLVLHHFECEQHQF